MDPLTQGLLGAVAVRNSRNSNAQRGVSVALGFFAGMAADLDVLIRSSSDSFAAWFCTI